MRTATTAPATTTSDAEFLTAAMAHLVVADPDADDAAMMVTGTNGNGGTCTMEVALDDGGAFAVRPHQTILPIDHDHAERQGEFEEIRAAAIVAGLPHIEVESGGEAHRRHLFVLIGEVDPAVRERLVAGCTARGMDCRQGPSDRIRPPFSPHRTGELPVLVHPADPWDAVDVMQGAYPSAAAIAAFEAAVGCDPAPKAPPARAARPAARPKVTRPASRRRVSGDVDTLDAEYRELLVDGTSGDVSAARFGVVWHMMNAGWADEDITGAFKGSPLTVKARTGRTIRPRELEADLRRAHEKLKLSPRFRDADDVREHISDMQARAAGHRWARGMGPSPDSLRKTLYAFLAECSKVGSVTSVGASAMLLAEGTRLGSRTTAATMKVLVQYGVLAKEQGGRSGKSAVYTVVRGHHVFRAAPVARVVDPSHVAWARGALGSAMGTFQQLHPDRPLHHDEVASKTGVGGTQARVMLRRLAAHGLAFECDGEWTGCADADLDRLLDAVVVACGLETFAQDQVDAHAERRRKHKEHRASEIKLAAERQAESMDAYIADADERAAAFEGRLDALAAKIAAHRAKAVPPVVPHAADRGVEPEATRPHDGPDDVGVAA